MMSSYPSEGTEKRSHASLNGGGELNPVNSDTWDAAASATGGINGMGETGERLKDGRFHGLWELKPSFLPSEFAIHENPLLARADLPGNEARLETEIE